MARQLHTLLVVLVACACATACAGAIVRPSVTPDKPAQDALLILPGFGYGGGAEQTFRRLADDMAREGVDLYVPTYISRSGLSRSRERLQAFIDEHRLNRYERLHVFAFIAGAWTFNPLMQGQPLQNLTTVIYDRSPFQERAPRIAAEEMHFLTWLRYGSPVFDVARTAYVPFAAPDVKVGLVVESTPTPFVRHHEKTARSYGDFHFECDAFLQRHDDCIYVPMNHEELYARFTELWPELLTFIRTGRFNSAAGRTPPSGDPFAR